MAFRLPTQAPPQRQASYSRPERPSTLQIPSAESQQQQDDDSREWVLFSPSQAPSTTRTHTDSTDRTARTAGLSRLSDFGSLNYANRLEDAAYRDQNSEDALEEDVTELDSLDDGLQAFRESNSADPNFADSTHPVLPTHDGLGSFYASGELVQEQLWRHEQYNPRRPGGGLHRRRSSVQRHLETVQERETDDAEHERWQRIEKWRMEQGRILLQEIERETKRHQRRNSRASLGSDRTTSRPDVLDSISETRAMDTASSSTTETQSSQGDSTPEESFWRRITRKVIRDLIGIDDSLLSVILGESLVQTEDATTSSEEQAPTTWGLKVPEDMDREIKDMKSMPGDQDFWQDRLLQRIARELGVLVHQIWEHPGAFSTYLRSGESPADFYAGIPVSRSEKEVQSASAQLTSDSGNGSMFSPHFTPTLRDPATAEHASHWGIEDDDMAPEASGLGHVESDENAADEYVSDSARLQREHEYWERELNVRMVFRYLRNRFRRGDGGHAGGHRAGSMSTDQDPSRRAAIIRQHHPLVAHAHARSQAQRLQLRTQSQGPSSPIARHRFRRPSSSCASQSTKVSTKRTLPGMGSGSSRHYWDIGGSVGSGSAVVSVGGPAGVGAWGEV